MPKKIHEVYDFQADPIGVLVAATFVFDGGGSVIATGPKADLYVPYAATIVDWTLLADQTGSIQIDLWKDSYANYPPVDGDSICASALPLISAAAKGQSATLTGWTTSIAAGDILRPNVDSVTSITRAVLTLKLRKA